jgi:cell division septal protein FtsQ
LVAVAAVAAYWFGIRDRAVAPTVSAPVPAATIENGSEPVVVSSDGAVVSWLTLPEGETLPQLPAVEPPKGGRLKGPMLEQARVLGAVPDALRPYVERSYHGENGVNVVLSSGIELRFGDDSRASRKWRAAAAVLADPAITALDYVNLRVPSRPAVYGSGHLLPPLP